MSDYADWTREQLVAEVRAMAETVERLAENAQTEQERLRAAMRATVIAIETVLMGDHVDMKLTATALLGRTSAALRGALELDGGERLSVPASEQLRAEVLAHTVTARNRDRMRSALALGNKMMGTMRGHASPADERAWTRFELALADLCNDGLLDPERDGKTPTTFAGRLLIQRDELQARVESWGGDGAEYRHALEHVVDCTEGCEQCRTLAQATLDRTTMGKPKEGT